MAASNTHPVPPAGNRILVVDDDELVLAALRETLRSLGYEVEAVGDPVQALARLQSQQFSVLITDQCMPAMTGLEFLSEARRIQPDATRILITAVLNLSTVIDAINKGEIFRFVIKPWLREELLATIKNAVQRYELICSNRALQASTMAMNERLATLNQELACQVAQVEDQNQQLARLNTALAQNLQHSVELCVNTLETFYPALGSQARRVYELAHAMADELNLPSDERQVLEIAGWLHDIGLVGVPRPLIRKFEEDPDALSESERTLIEHHPVLGQELARFVQPLEGVGQVIRSHHERVDGNGYPDGLMGENIPWLARLLTVAVGYAHSIQEPGVTTEFIRHDSGTAYDPEAVRVFMRCLPKVAVTRRQRQIGLDELRPGMVLARGIYTPSGLLLVPDGQKLSEPYIDKLLNHNRVDPITQSLLVFG
ncbi:MAG: response regulator [Pedosphaera sp.]|nr:response regulator [Pedosphaera sp.]